MTNLDHIKFDLQTSTAWIVGTMTKEEEMVYDEWLAQMLTFRLMRGKPRKPQQWSVKCMGGPNQS